MTDEQQKRVHQMRAEHRTIQEIADELDVYTHSVRWVLNHAAMLEKARAKRRAAGAMAYSCSLCGGQGHNVRTCPGAA